jgi:HAD superfamily hydrolase (TIGR01509 family)
MKPQAVVFDFDGLVVDTETPEYTIWAEIFAEHGQHLTVLEWGKSVGAAPGTWTATEVLESLIGPYDKEAVKTDHKNRLKARTDSLGPMPGILDWVADLQREGIPHGIASSSVAEWVNRFLETAGLVGVFPVIVTRTETLRAKPNPDLYLEACRQLGADPAASVAFEDSTNGIKAAKAAGMWGIAVPCPVTVTFDFSMADRVVPSLAEFRLPDLVQMMGPGSPSS